MDNVVSGAAAVALGAVLALACGQKPAPAAPAVQLYTSSKRFEGKVAVVTGAASGLGLATAERILRDGGRVLMTDVNATALAAEVRRLEKVSGAKSVRGVTKDISTRDGADSIIAAAEAEWGHVDVLVNSAGSEPFLCPLICHWRICSLPLTPLNAMRRARAVTARNVRPEADFEERWDTVMKVNVKGTMLMCHAAVEAFRRRSANGHAAESAAIVREHVYP